MVDSSLSPTPCASTLVSTARMAPDYLDVIALSHLELLLRVFHVPIRNLSCKAEYLEELFYTALTHRYPDAEIHWNAGSHAVGVDISVIEPSTELDAREYGFSVKTGKERQVRGAESVIAISGSRLQSRIGVDSIVGRSSTSVWESGGQGLVDWLNAHHRDVVVLMAPSLKESGAITYEVRYISPEMFVYPPASEWEKVGAEFRVTLPSGIVASLKPAMSWQIWWDIPKNATRLIRKIRVPI